MKKQVIYFGLIILILPFFVLAFYIQPQNDDFHFAMSSKEGLSAFFSKYYFNFTGRYFVVTTAYFLNPLKYDFNMAMIGLKIITISFLLSFWGVLYYFFKNILQTNTSKITESSFLYATFFFAFILYAIPSLSEFLYWFVGANAYFLPIIFLFIFYSFLFRYLFDTSKYNIFLYIFLQLLNIIVIGCHELLVVFHGAILFFLWTHHYINTKKICNPIFYLLVIAFIASCVMISAPGNFARLNAIDTSGQNLDFYAQKPILKLIILTLYFTISDVGNWLNNGSLWILSFVFIPIFYQIHINFKLNIQKIIHPFFFVFLSFMLFWLIYALNVRLGHYQIPRVQSLLYLLFLILFFCNLQILASYIFKANKIDDNIMIVFVSNYKNISKNIMLFLIILMIMPSAYLVNSAYYEIFLVAPKYANFNQKRFIEIQEAVKRKEKSIKLEQTPKALKSIFLFHEDFKHKDFYYNRNIAGYFGIDEIDIIQNKDKK